MGVERLTLPALPTSIANHVPYHQNQQKAFLFRAMGFILFVIHVIGVPQLWSLCRSIWGIHSPLHIDNMSCFLLIEESVVQVARKNTVGTILSTVSVNLKLPGCKLEVVESPGPAVSKEFEQRRLKIGRSAELENDLVLEDPSVSGFHCELIYDEESGYRLRDHGSTNGIWLGDIRIYDAHITTPVRITVGDSVVLFTPLERTYKVTQKLGDEIAGFHFRDREMRQLCVRARKLVQLGIGSILLHGETGSGKGAIAAILESDCREQKKPFETVNCAAIPENLLESELFGHVKGAFTGADRNHIGAFKRADGGILFLDEMGELPLQQQAKLLTSLDKRMGRYEFRPIGARKTESSSFTLLAGTNRNLRKDVEDGRFREDLYYRIAGSELHVPPLRERPNDIECLLDVVLDELSKKHGEQVLTLASDVRKDLLSYNWPGNVRELLHTIRHAAAHAMTVDRYQITVEDLPSQVLRGIEGRPQHITQEIMLMPPGDEIPAYHAAKTKVLESFQKEYIARILQHTNGNVSQASRVSGMDRKRISDLKKKYQIS